MSRFLVALRRWWKPNGLKEWEKKYYTPARDSIGTDWAAILHSIRKWEGLRPHILKQYELRQDGSFLVDEHTNADFVVGTSTCALCEKYMPSPGSVPVCSKCPIYKSEGVTCSREYNKFVYHKNPEPMIDLLERIRIRELRRKERKG